MWLLFFSVHLSLKRHRCENDRGGFNGEIVFAFYAAPSAAMKTSQNVWTVPAIHIYVWPL